MPEGVATATGQVTAGVHDDPDSPPPASAEAPKGWAWQRKTRSWSPRQRGPVLWHIDKPGAAPSDHQRSGNGDPGETPDGSAPGQQDPDPSWMRDETNGSSSGSGDGDGDGDRIPYDEVPQAVKDDIAGLAGLIGTPILAMLRSVDPYCGTALAENFEPIVDATLPLICRSSKIVRYFAEDKADWLLWGKLALALKPVGQAILQHHIFRTVEVVTDKKTGQKYARPTGQQGSEHGDHLQPPVQYAA